MDASDSPRPPRSRAVPFHELSVAFQLVFVAALTLANVIFFDWDAGMVAGALVAETLTIWLLFPWVWTVVDWRWHDVTHPDAVARQRRIDAGDATDEDHTIAARRRHRTSLRPFSWAKSLAGNLGVVIFTSAFGGILPIILLSVATQPWPEWAGNWAATHWGLPPIVGFFLWPIALAVGLASEWPSFTWTVAAVCLVVVLQVISASARAFSRAIEPKDLDDDSIAQMSMATVPLFIMAGISLAVGGWLAEHRTFRGAWTHEDAAVWSLVILIVLRSVIGGLRRALRRSDRALRSGDRERLANTDRSLAYVVVATLVGLAGVGAFALAMTEPRTEPLEPDPSACLTAWRGAFHPETRAALSNWDDAWNADAHTACERITSATSLHLRAPLHPDDLRLFTAVRSLTLTRGAHIHLGDLALLPSVEGVHLIAPGPIDLSTLAPSLTLRRLSIQDATVRSAERVWSTPGLESVHFVRVELGEGALPTRRVRTTVRELSLEAVRGDVDAFLFGGLGVEKLRLVDTPVTSTSLRRLLWVRQLVVDDGLSDEAYCAIVGRMMLVGAERARSACGHVTL
jgi:hypothetical protein